MIPAPRLVGDTLTPRTGRTRLIRPRRRARVPASRGATRASARPACCSCSAPQACPPCSSVVREVTTQPPLDGQPPPSGERVPRAAVRAALVGVRRKASFQAPGREGSLLVSLSPEHLGTTHSLCRGRRER